MFTGIVEEVGAIKNIKRGQHSAVLTIHAKTVLEETRIGDSIAVNGICLTVTRLFPDGFSADVMHETLNRSSLAGLTAAGGGQLERGGHPHRPFRRRLSVGLPGGRRAASTPTPTT